MEENTWNSLPLISLNMATSSILIPSYPSYPSLFSCFEGNPNTIGMQLCNPSQPKHELELKKYLKPYICDGCKEIGFGPRYRCERCDFDLHKACMFEQISPIPHGFFPPPPFKFLRTLLPKDKRKQNRKDNLYLHPCCGNLNRNNQIEDGKCIWCQKKSIRGSDRGNDWSCVSKCGEYHVHVAGITEMALEERYKSGGDWINADNANQGQQLAAQKVNQKAIEARRRGDGRRGNKFWRIVKVLIKTIVSMVLEDPTTVLASIFAKLIE